MKYGTLAAVFLTLTSSAIALDISRLLWIGSKYPTVVEEAQVVEVVRWRQPVCVIPGKGVPSCLRGLRKFQTEYERLRGKGLSEEKPDESKLVKSKLSDTSNLDDRPTGTKILSSDIVSSLSLDTLQSSESEYFIEDGASKLEAETPGLSADQERNVRQGKYLQSAEDREQPYLKPHQIYVTKVLESPMTATLVAYNCLPDIGVPLCEEYRGSVASQGPKPTVVDREPSLSVSVEVPRPFTEEQKPGNFWQDSTSPSVNSNGDQTSGPAWNKPIIEAIRHEFQKPRPEVIIRKPDIVQSVSVVSSVPENPSFVVSTIGESDTQNVGTVTDDKPYYVETIHKPGIMSSFLPAGFHFFESRKPLAANQLGRPELTIEVPKESVFTTSEDTRVLEESTSGSDLPSGNKPYNHPIVQTIHGIMNKSEKSTIIQTLQHLLHKPSQENGHRVSETKPTAEGASTAGIFGNLFKPGGIFDRERTTTTASQPELLPVTLENSPNDSNDEDAIRPSLTNVGETSLVSETEREPEKEVSGSPGVLNIFLEVGANEARGSLAESTEKSGPFVDLSANRAQPIETEKREPRTRGSGKSFAKTSEEIV